MALFLIVVQAHFIMNNVFEGMIWFFLPASLVITNDIFAYICGITFGRTQLIKLSPKKTVEGFVGAWIMTIIFGIFFADILLRSKYFICPVNDLGANIFTGLECVPNPVFTPQTYTLPQYFFLPPNTSFSFTMAPIQLHTFVFATFASLIAPFGGFFASGLKRTFKIKDFGHSIPGHGGMTDRMDCQFTMGFFTYMYYHTFIATHKLSVGGVMEMAITGLTPEEQIELIRGVGRYLSNQGTVKESVSSSTCSSLCCSYAVANIRRFWHVSTRRSQAGDKGFGPLGQLVGERHGGRFGFHDDRQKSRINNRTRGGKPALSGVLWNYE